LPGPHCPTMSTRRPERPPDPAWRIWSGDDAGRDGPRRSRTIGSQPHPVLTERSSRVVAAVKLHRQLARRRTQRCLVEGANLVDAASRRGLIREIFVTEAAAQRYATLLASHDAAVHLVTERAAKALSDTVTPAGLVAVCELPSLRLEDVLIDSPRLVAVGVEIGEPGNAGTLIRIADAMAPRQCSSPATASTRTTVNACVLRRAASSRCRSSSHRMRVQRSATCRPPDCRCWPPPWTVSCRSMMRDSRHRRQLHSPATTCAGGSAYHIHRFFRSVLLQPPGARNLLCFRAEARL